MRKFKLLIALLAVLTAATGAIAFNRITRKQSLYYYNSNDACVAAPCQTQDQTGKACLLTVYTDTNCHTLYTGSLWASESD